jgi:hypothetical protein
MGTNIIMSTYTIRPSLVLYYLMILRSQVSMGRHWHNFLELTALQVSARNRVSPYPIIELQEAISIVLNEVRALPVTEEIVRVF